MFGFYRFGTTQFAASSLVAPPDTLGGGTGNDGGGVGGGGGTGGGGGVVVPPPPEFDAPELMPTDYFPGGYLPGVWSPPGAAIGGLRDGAVFDAIVALFGSNGLSFESVTYGGRFDSSRMRGRGPALHVRKVRFANKADENPTLMARRVDFELTVAWRADLPGRAAQQTEYVAGFAESFLSGQPIGGFCIPHETMVRGGTVDDTQWPLVKVVMTGQVVYEWDTLYGVTVERFVPPAAMPPSTFDPETLRLRLIRYLRTCANLKAWNPVIRGWEGEPYPEWPPRHDELPFLMVHPTAGRSAWKYEDQYVLTTNYGLTVATRYPDSTGFANFFGAVFRALYPPREDPDSADRDACFAALDIEGMGSGQMTSQPTPPRLLGHDPYALIGTARCEFLINVVAR